MAAAGRNGPHGEPFIWLLRVGSLIKDPPSNWIRLLPGWSEGCLGLQNARLLL